MWKMYSCPNCGAPVAYGVRFCGNCGSNLSTLVQQLLTSSAALSHDYQNLNPPQNTMQQRQVHTQQTGWPQKPGRDQQAYRHVPVHENQKQQQRREIEGNSVAISQGKGSSVEATAKPIRAEIIKLMSGLFDTQIKRN